MESRNGKRMMTAAGRYAYSRFALNFTMYYESMADYFRLGIQNFDRFSPAEKEMLDGLRRNNQELIALVCGFLRGETTVAKMHDFRCRILQDAEKTAAYIDCFGIYDYVLKRLEGRFEDEDEEPVTETDREIVNEMMRFVVSAEESMERNQRIKMLLAELPMRFTRNKFFSMIRQSLTVYEGADRQTLEQAIKALKREALLTLPQGMEEGHTQLYKNLKKLEEADYKNLDKDGFLKLKEVFGEARDILFNQSTDRMSLMEIVNDLYVMCLAGPDMLMDSREKEELQSLVSLVAERIEKDDYSLTDEELENHLIPLEGVQEAYYDQWSRFEDANIEVFLGKNAPEQDKETAAKVLRLLSTSIYAPLEPEEQPEEEGILLSRKAVEVMCQPFCDELEKDWKKKPKCVVRAMMATLLSKLPMFFLSSDELREFLLGCLSSCTDAAEKSTCIEEILRIMEMEDDLV